MAPPRTATWDPILLISQIVSIQALHYLTLSLFIPPLLNLFADPNGLIYEGGAANVGMVMDWREMAGLPTVHGLQGDNRRGWDAFRGVYSGGKKVSSGLWSDGLARWDGRTDPARGWVIASCWMIAASIDVFYLYYIVRRPRLILDFACTLVFNHIVLTTYYSAALPSSLFFWLVVVAGASVSVVFAEQMCVRREMREGLSTAPPEIEEMEMGGRAPRID